MRKRLLATLLVAAATSAIYGCNTGAPTATVHGTIRAEGVAKAGFTVTVAGKTATTNADGSYVMTGVRSGDTTLTVHSTTGTLCHSQAARIFVPDTTQNVNYQPLTSFYIGCYCDASIQLPTFEYMNDCS